MASQAAGLLCKCSRERLESNDPAQFMLDPPPPGPVPQNVNGRYEIKDAPIGQGGMGIVYKAYDNVTKRYVALKTMWGHVDPAALELFEREWTVLARLSHPNIVDILDTGEFRENGNRKPYFVMPLLPGLTLDYLVKSSSQRLTVERTVEIICQACRGLQAAHDQGLVHRDLKPSNIFVMDDDSVKIIDFGVVHLADARSVTGIKGTLQYMAPEQIEMKPATALSDIFSLGVVCYEAFTSRKPFARRTEAEVIEAIRTYIPPPASQINASVNQLLSRTVHKAMAKQPWHRFSTAREFAETLQKAIRNEPIERFDRSKIQPRIERIKKAQAEGDHQFAMEILTELESEGHIDPEMSLIRLQSEQAIRQKTIRQLLESARTRMEEDEYPLALQKVQEVLNIDPDNVDASSLRKQIERQRSENQIENWFRLVGQHLDNQDYSQARQGVQEILKINSSDTRARELLAQIDRTQQDVIRAREEQQKLYDAALASYKNGEISTALSKLERLLDLNRTGPKTATPDRDAQFQSLYNQVRSEREAARNAYSEGRKHLLDRNFSRALEICQEYLQKHPGDPLFHALKIETEEAQRQEQSAAVAEIHRRVEAEPDLDKKYNILKEAVEKHPHEAQFKSSLNLQKERRDLINSIAGRARQYEERGQLNDAAGQWDILKNIYPLYPGLDLEIQRLGRRREEQARDEAKARWTEKIDRHLGDGEYAKAREVVQQALLEFPDDQELQGLDALAEQGMKRSAEAATLLREGQALLAEKKYEEGLDALRKADRLDERNPAVRSALLAALLQRARELMSHDWRASEPLIREAVEIDASDPVVRSLESLIDDYKRQDAVASFILGARNLQAAGDLSGALKKVEEGLRLYPNEIRLSQLHGTLRNAASDSRHRESVSGRAPEKSAPPANPKLQLPDLPPPIETIVQPASAPSRPPTPPAATVVQLPPPIKPALPEPPVQASKSQSIDKKHRLLWAGALAAAVVVIGIAVLVTTRTAPHSVVKSPTPAAAHGPTKLPNPQPLAQQLPELRITSNLKQGQLVLDEGQAEDLQDGSVSKADIPAGPHTAKIRDGNRDVLSFAFNVSPNEAATLSAPPKGSGVVVASMGEKATVYAGPGTRGAPEGQALLPIPAEGLAVPVPAQGSARVMVGDANSKPRPVSIDFATAPLLNVVLSGAPERIPLLVTADVPDALVLIDGRPTKLALVNGKRVVPLLAGNHRVSLQKDDYQQPEEQMVELKSGDAKQQTLSFHLAPIAHNATLAIEGAPDGAEVLIDGESKGKASGGAFSTEITPGSHRIVVSNKPSYDDFSVTKDFKAGETTKISADGMKGRGTIVLAKISPSTAHVSFHRAFDVKTFELQPNVAQTLPVGDYIVSAEAENYIPDSHHYTVSVGKSVSVEFALTPQQSTQAVKIDAKAMFENGSSWTEENGWWAQNDSGFSFLRAGQGTFLFSVLKDKKKGVFKTGVKPIIFVADYRDRGDRIVYTLDAHNLTKRIFSGGHGGEETKVDHGMEGLQWFAITVDIKPDKITIKNASGKVLDQVQRSGTPGKFGFQGPITLTATPTH